MDTPIRACFIVDDMPINATYWAQAQKSAIGFTPAESGWATRWRDMAPTSRLRVADAEAFADMIEELGIRGKFTFLPCPAGLGRVDQCVRGFPDRDLARIISIVRDRIAKRMDITPEVLTHTQPYDPESGARLPHAETFWLTHLCVTGQTEKLRDYLRHAWKILHNVGLHPRGLTVGGMTDYSDVARGKSLACGHGRGVLGRALLEVEREFDHTVRTSFIYTGAPSYTKRGKRLRSPECVYKDRRGAKVFELQSIQEDPVLPVILGPSNAVRKTTDRLISPDLKRGWLVKEAESGKALVFTVHCQTLGALGTGAGVKIMRETCRRLKQRYGARLKWHTALELCKAIGA